MPIVGTAGHVDHGKSALVAALTGTNPDRLLEERERGMTLDLGFARLVFEDGTDAGIVDVPGHERFLHNMLAGAAGIDVLLLVVAADEGVKPQTLEHLAILRHLNVRATIVVVSKIDLVPESARAAMRAQIDADLRDTIAERAPVVETSSRSGAGLPELRAAIAGALRELPPRDPGAPVYLPIDRVFTLPGLGTVVTGTLMQGRVGVGDVLALEPSAQRARIRSLEVFGSRRDRVEAGTRVALNLAAIDRHTIARGETLASAAFEPRRSFAVRFTAAHGARRLLRRRTPVRAYLGTAEILGTLAFDGEPGAGETAATLHLRAPAVAFPGVRFVLRRPSPKTLLGGGLVVGFAQAERRDASSPARDAVLAVLRARGIAPADPAAVAFEANLREDVARETLEALVASGEAIRLRRPETYAGADAAQDLLAGITAALEAAQRDEPWAMGVTSIALSRSIGMAEPLLVRFLAEFVDAGRLAGRAGYYATLDFAPSLTAQQREFFSNVAGEDAQAPLRPARFADAVAAVRSSDVRGAGRAFDTLLGSGELVKVGDDLYRGSQIGAVLSRVEAHFRSEPRMTAAQFRDAIGTSRKYAMPLLEWLDARGVTVRDGDYRTLRRRAAGEPVPPEGDG